jgi:hypothetical protein
VLVDASWLFPALFSAARWCPDALCVVVVVVGPGVLRGQVGGAAQAPIGRDSQPAQGQEEVQHLQPQDGEEEASDRPINLLHATHHSQGSAVMSRIATIHRPRSGVITPVMMIRDSRGSRFPSVASISRIAHQALTRVATSGRVIAVCVRVLFAGPGDGVRSVGLHPAVPRHLRAFWRVVLQWKQRSRRRARALRYPHARWDDQVSLEGGPSTQSCVVAAENTIENLKACGVISDCCQPATCEPVL